MLCTRCHQHEAREFPAKRRAELEAEFDAPLPWFRNDLCNECWGEWFREWYKTPEAKADMDRLGAGLRKMWRRDVDTWEQNVRSTATKVLDFADRLAGKLS